MNNALIKTGSDRGLQLREQDTGLSRLATGEANSLDALADSVSYARGTTCGKRKAPCNALVLLLEEVSELFL